MASHIRGEAQCPGEECGRILTITIARDGDDVTCFVKNQPCSCDLSGWLNSDEMWESIRSFDTAPQYHDTLEEWRGER